MYRRLLIQILALGLCGLSLPASACLCAGYGLRDWHLRPDSGLFIARYIYASIDPDRYPRYAGNFDYKLRVEKNISSEFEEGSIYSRPERFSITSCNHVPRFLVGDLVLTTGDFTNMCALKQKLESMSSADWDLLRKLKRGEDAYQWWLQIRPAEK
jgi:hypothetical protein